MCIIYELNNNNNNKEEEETTLKKICTIYDRVYTIHRTLTQTHSKYEYYLIHAGNRPIKYSHIHVQNTNGTY